MEIHSSVVPQVVPVGFADLAQAADRLPGTALTAGDTRLEVEGRAGVGLADAVRYTGTLRTSALLPAMKVEVVVSPWSAGKSEVAIHPVTNLRRLDSLRAKRFFRAALSVLPVLVERLGAETGAEVPAVLELAA